MIAFPAFQVTGSIRRFSAELFVWLLPLVVVAEYVGTTFGNTVAATSGLLAIFLGVLWLTPPAAPASPLPRRVMIAGRVLGVALVVAGAWGLSRALLPFIEPAHYPPPPQATLREREAFLYAGVLWCYPVAFGLRLIRGRAAGRDVERLGLFIALVLVTHLAAKQSVQGLPVLPYGRPGLALALNSVEVVLWALVLVPRVPSYFRLFALLGAGLGLRFVGLSTWQLDPGLRDMLPLVKSAQDAFFTGTNPYGLHQMQPGSVVPLTYLPGMWLLWGLPRLLGADLRLTGLLADAAVVAGLYWVASGVAKPARDRAQGIALSFSAVWLFSPSMAWNGIYAEPHAWWLVLAVLLAATLRRRWWLAAAALGVALATRHFALVVAPFVLLAMLRDLRWRRALPRVALAGTITALLYVPFVARDPGSFWFGTYRWLVEYGPVHQSWFWEKFGFSGPLYQAHGSAWLPRAQLALPLACFVLALYFNKSRALFAALGTAYVLFVMFNGIIWDSFYLDCSLFAAYAAAGGHALEQRLVPVVARPSRRVLAVSVAVSTLTLALGGWLAFSLVSSQSHAGQAEARAFLAKSLTAGDVLVDRSAWNIAFIQEKPLLQPRSTSGARWPRRARPSAGSDRSIRTRTGVLRVSRRPRRWARANSQECRRSIRRRAVWSLPCARCARARGCDPTQPDAGIHHRKSSRASLSRRRPSSAVDWHAAGGRAGNAR